MGIESDKVVWRGKEKRKCNSLRSGARVSGRKGLFGAVVSIGLFLSLSLTISALYTRVSQMKTLNIFIS